MATLIKTVMGGIVAKNVKLQVFLEPKMYLELVNEAKRQDIKAKTDSGLICSILNKFLYSIDEISALRLQIEQLRKGIANRTSIIEELRAEISDLKPKKVKK